MLLGTDEWLRKEIFMEQAYIEHILPSQPGEYIIIAGRSGIGKSTLAMQMGFSLASGLPFLGFNTEKVQTGYICMEGSKENIKDRLHKLKGVFRGANFYFNYYQPLNLFTKFDYILGETNGCQVLAFDNLKQLASGKYLDCAYARDWCERFRELLYRCNSVGILTIHVRKASQAYFVEPGDLDSVKGSEYTEAATTVLLLERPKHPQDSKGRFLPTDSTRVNLYFPKTRISTFEISMLQLKLDRSRAIFNVI